MKTNNLISVYQGASAIEVGHPNDSKEIKMLKKHEIRNLHSLCDILKHHGCKIKDLDGFYVGYTIKQISKEFDLLRIGKDFVLNIELKSELKVADKLSKITMQMQRNLYYLKIFSQPIFIFEFVENDGLYKYDIINSQCIKCDFYELIKLIKKQDVDYSVDLDDLFIPSHFLISPFNSTDKFMADDYFLTTQQERIKNEIIESLQSNQMIFFTLSANAGTGKTLLLYDLAKSFMNENKKVRIIHCGKCNEGHHRLNNSYGWSITPISNIPSYLINSACNLFSGDDIILVDESQRIRRYQLENIVGSAISFQIPVIFSFDVKQYLKDGETLDIFDYLIQNYTNIPCEQKKLTNKIRTNKSMASFITNLLEMGKSNDNLDYSCVSIDYFNESTDAEEYADYLKQTGWTFITFTTSLVEPEKDPYYNLSIFSEINAHDVIGQEFPKVALVMDNNFIYENGKLKNKKSYYNAGGMLYQIVG